MKRAMKRRCGSGGPPVPTPYLGGKIMKRRGKGFGAIATALAPHLINLIPKGVKAIKNLVKKIKDKKAAKKLAKLAKDNPNAVNTLKDLGKKGLNLISEKIKNKTGESTFNTLKDAGDKMYREAVKEWHSPKETQSTTNLSAALTSRPTSNEQSLPFFRENKPSVQTAGSMSIKQDIMNPRAYLAKSMNELRTFRNMRPRPMPGIRFDGEPKNKGGKGMKGPIP